MTVFAILLCGFLDRMRGSPKNIINRTVEKFLYGLVVAYLTVGFDNWMVSVAFAAFFALGSSPGWGEPYAAALLGREMDKGRLEWWQVGKMEDSAWFSLTIRGFLWALPCLIVSKWNIHALEVLVMGAVFPLALWIAIKIDEWKMRPDPWADSELIRGLLLGVCCAAL